MQLTGIPESTKSSRRIPNADREDALLVPRFAFHLAQPLKPVKAKKIAKAQVRVGGSILTASLVVVELGSFGVFIQTDGLAGALTVNSWLAFNPTMV